MAAFYVLAIVALLAVIAAVAEINITHVINFCGKFIK